MLWSRIAEWCAGALGATRGARWAPRFVAMAALLGLSTLVLATRFGAPGLVPLGIACAVVLVVGGEVFFARDRLWAAARLPLDHPKQRVPQVGSDDGAVGPTALALRRLAVAVDHARRSRYAAASDLLPQIPRRLLRPEELHLLDAVRAMVSLGLGDDRRAAQQAILALPTGSDEMDRSLGRAVIADAWRDDDRLRAIDSAWEGAGVDASGIDTLPRLRRLVRVRVDPSALDSITAGDARELSDEARAVGDDDLAGELDYRARRSQTYR